MPKLDQRLIAVTRRIRSGVHADIGSDHGLLLASLLASGRIDYGIAVENKQQPFENSRQTLTGLAAEVRLGDGMEVLKCGEADSLSICGMGAENMRSILERYPDRIPAEVVLQPNSRAPLIREWAWQAGFWLAAEQVVRTTGKYAVLSFRRAPAGACQEDPAYTGVDRAYGFEFGPLLLKERCADLLADILEEKSYWSQFSRLRAKGQKRLALVNAAIDGFNEPRCEKAAK